MRNSSSNSSTSNALVRRDTGAGNTGVSGQRVPSSFRPAGLFDDFWLDPFSLLGSASGNTAASPFHLMRRMQEDMDRLFSQVWGGSGLPGSGINTGINSSGALLPGSSLLVPSVDVSETDREYRIDVELPGIAQDAIDIRVVEGTLIVRAETRSEQSSPHNASVAASAGEQGQQQESQQQTTPTRQYHYRERRYGRYERAFHLPPAADEDNIRAEFQNGVLTLIVAKKEPQQWEDRGGRRIAIGGTVASSHGDSGNGKEGEQQSVDETATTAASA